MTQKYCKYGVGAFLVLSMGLSVTSALAYQFGAMPITELVEDGSSQNRFLLSLGTENISVNTNGIVNNSKPQGSSTVGEWVLKKGDKSGGSSTMFRVGTFEDSFGYTGWDVGMGLGWEWDMLSDRSLGIVTNLQLDYQQSTLKTNSNVDSGELFYNGELGILYRIFAEKLTITPFALIRSGGSSWSVSQQTTTYTDTSTIGSSSIGVDVMYGKFSLSYSQNASNQVYAKTPGTTQKITGSTISIGYNF